MVLGGHSDFRYFDFGRRWNLWNVITKREHQRRYSHKECITMPSLSLCETRIIVVPRLCKGVLFFTPSTIYMSDGSFRTERSIYCRSNTTRTPME